MKKSGGVSVAKNLLAHNLKKIRKSRGYTQVDFALKLGIKQAELSQFEAAKRGFSPESLDSIAKALDCEPWELLKPDADFSLPSVEQRPSPVDHLSAGATSGELSAADGAVILSEMAKLSLPQRNFLLAILFRDASLADGTGESALSAALQVIQKAE